MVKALRGWKKTESKLKSVDEAYFVNFQRGKRSVEVIKHGRDFEVWEQIADKSRNPGSWKGTHLGTFRDEKRAVSFARRQL
jgi:hypothetical protein